jgi:RNA polymerase sigma-70 factor (ECF subfamily)
VPPIHDLTGQQAADEALVHRIAAGEADALVEIFRRHRTEVYRFAVHMTGRPATADDVTQDVFVTLIREAARFDAARGTVQAWLLGITRNLVRRRLLRDRWLAPLDDVDMTSAPLTLLHDPADDLEREQQIAVLRRAVMALPVRYREVVLLCDLQELSYQDTAAVLGCAVGTVRSRLHRARVLLAQKLRKVSDGRKPAVALA